MSWTLQCFIFIVMMTSAYNCKHNFGHLESAEYSENITYHAQPIPLFHQSNNHHKMIEQSNANVGRLNIDKRRSSVHTNTQKVQEQERRRISPGIEEPYRRIENGSYKILNYPSVLSRRGVKDDSSVRDRIVFPGPTSNEYSMPTIPDECKSIGICEKIPNYPKDVVTNVIVKLDEAVKKYNIDELDIPDTPDIAQRLGPQEESKELCFFKEKILYPEGAIDKDGNWAVIVNRQDKPVQGFRVEICHNNSGPCSDIADFQPGYQASCRQKYVYRSMLALDKNGNPVENMFKVPSCCSCVIRVLI